MLNTAQLHDELTGLIGLYPTLSSSTPVLPALSKTPVVYLQDAHKLLRTDVLTALGPNLLESTVADYDEDTTYRRYDLVSDSDNVVFESLVDNNDAVLTDATKWKQTTYLAAWFGRIERGAINKLALACSGNPPALPLLDRMTLYQKEGNVQQTINKLGRFCGLRLSILKSDVSLGLINVGLQLSSSVSNLPIYLFRSGQTQPVKTVSLTTSVGGRTGWVPVGEWLYNSGADYYLEGEYYLIGYFEDDLPNGVNAVSGERNLSQLAGCSGCQPYDYELHKARSPFVKIEAVTVDNPGDSRTLNWLIEEVSIMQTFGLNLLIEAQPNATSALIRHKDMLLNALLYTVACDALEELAYSDRVNSVKSELRPLAYAALNGQGKSDSDTGLKAERNRIVSGLKAQLGKVSSMVLPEKPKRGIRFETSW